MAAMGPGDNDQADTNSSGDEVGMVCMNGFCITGQHSKKPSAFK
jgi:hypothetical protein